MYHNNNIFIGVTGGISSGKTEFCGILSKIVPDNFLIINERNFNPDDLKNIRDRIIIIKGTTIFTNENMIKINFSVKIFIDTPSDKRLINYINKKQLNEHTITNILEKWEEEIKPLYKKETLSQRMKSDIIVQNFNNEIFGMLESLINSIKQKY